MITHVILYFIAVIEMKYTIQFIEEEWNYKFIYLDRKDGKALREKVIRNVSCDIPCD